MALQSETPLELVAPDSPLVRSRGYARTADDYGHIGISRRKFFRWKAAGEAAPGGPDLPPFDAPAELEAWYGRMRAGGAFSHQFPQSVRAAINAHLRGGAVGGSKSDTPPTSPAAASVPASFTVSHGSAQGLQFEIAAEEQRVAALRVARDKAYADNQRTEGDALDRQYRDALDALSLVQHRFLKIAEQEGRMVAVELVERELAPKLTSIVQGGLHLIDTVDAQLIATSDRLTRRAIWRKAWSDLCATLVEGRFAPPLQLESLAA